MKGPLDCWTACMAGCASGRCLRVISGAGYWHVSMGAVSRGKTAESMVPRCRLQQNRLDVQVGSHAWCPGVGAYMQGTLFLPRSSFTFRLVCWIKEGTKPCRESKARGLARGRRVSREKGLGLGLLGLAASLLPLWASNLRKGLGFGPKIGPIKCMGLEPNKATKIHR